MDNPLLRRWQTANKIPAGRFFLHWLVYFSIPYTGSVRPRILELEPGYAKVRMRDRRAFRNHLKSVHAVAQMNLAEFTTGLAMTALMSPQSRAIITGLSMEYVKKARGTLIAECRVEELDESESREHHIESIVRDGVGDIVSRATAVWLVGPQKRRSNEA